MSIIVYLGFEFETEREGGGWWDIDDRIGTVQLQYVCM